MIDENKEYLKGNLHTHTIKSDGKYSLKKTLNIYKEQNYDFLGITDHDIFCMEDMENDIVLLHGIEVSCIYSGDNKTKGEYVHFCCFDSNNDDENCIYYYSDISELKKCLKKLSRKYNIIQFNHPLFSRLLDNEAIQLENYNLIEVYNHKDYIEETGIQNAEQLIRTLLNNNKKVFVTAGDDFHGPYLKTIHDNCFGGYIMLESNKNEADIIKAIQLGKFYASTGPKIFDFRIEGRVLKIKTSPVKNIIFYTNMRKCKNIFDKNDNEIISGEYTLHGDEFYVWVKIIDKAGRSAWVQPFYIDREPYFN